MNSNKELTLKKKIAIFLSYFMQFLILIYIIFAFVEGRYLYLVGGTIAFIITFLPLILKHRLKITLPWTLNFLIVLSLYIYVGGHVRGWFITLAPFYDKFAHFISSATIALLGFSIVYVMDKFTNLRLKKIHIAIFIIFFTMAIGSFWEIGEFVLDQTLGTNAQHDLEETMMDLIFNFLGAVFISIISVVKLGEDFSKEVVEGIPKKELRRIRREIRRK